MADPIIHPDGLGRQITVDGMPAGVVAWAYPQGVLLEDFPSRLLWPGHADEGPIDTFITTGGILGNVPRLDPVCGTLYRPLMLERRTAIVMDGLVSPLTTRSVDAGPVLVISVTREAELERWCWANRQVHGRVYGSDWPWGWTDWRISGVFPPESAWFAGASLPVGGYDSSAEYPYGQKPAGWGLPGIWSGVTS